MDWLSLPVPVMLGPDFLRLPEGVRATWLSLLAFCALRENGGVIAAADSWSNRDWDRLAGTSKLGINKIVEGGLAWWEGGDLHVEHYPVGRERLLKIQRDAGAEGGRQSGRTRKSKASSSRTPSEGGDGTPPVNGEEGKVEESRGEESKGEESFALTHPDPARQVSPVTELRTAWVAYWNDRYSPDEYYWTGRDATDAGELLKLANGKGVAEIMRRARILGAQKREKSITPAILRMAWNELAGRPVPAPVKIDRLLDDLAAGRLP
jgi:hypothetical protein